MTSAVLNSSTYHALRPTIFFPNGILTTRDSIRSCNKGWA